MCLSRPHFTGDSQMCRLKYDLSQWGVRLDERSLDSLEAVDLEKFRSVFGDAGLLTCVNGINLRIFSNAAHREARKRGQSWEYATEHMIESVSRRFNVPLPTYP